MSSVHPECHGDNCENDARYVCADGKFYCALCAMGKVAIRFSDVPKLLWLVEAMSIKSTDGGDGRGWGFEEAADALVDFHRTTTGRGR